MTALQSILAAYRATSEAEREKGTYFEERIRTYFRYEASYADLYSDVWLFADWAEEIGTPQFGISAKDTGIDLVARTRGTEEYHAIQCKCYAPDYRVRKADIDTRLRRVLQHCATLGNFFVVSPMDSTLKKQAGTDQALRIGYGHEFVRNHRRTSETLGHRAFCNLAASGGNHRSGRA